MDLRRGCEANLVGTRSPRRAENNQRSHSAVAKLSWSLHSREPVTTQQILCCDSSAALGIIKRKGSTRETRHIELKAFFLQQWSGRPEVRLVQVGTSEMLADCSTKIQSTPNSVHLSSVKIPLLFFDIFVLVFFSPVLCGTHHTFYNDL